MLVIPMSIQDYWSSLLYEAAADRHIYHVHVHTAAKPRFLIPIEVLFLLYYVIWLILPEFMVKSMSVQECVYLYVKEEVCV